MMNNFQSLKWQRGLLTHVASLTSSLNLINKTMSGSFIPACNNWLLSNNMANQRLRNMLPRTTDNSREYT